jgi:general secretion pathway protein J
MSRGFTLIELLIALMIFALMSAAAYRSIDSLIASRTTVEQTTADVQTLNTAMTRLERDVQVALPRSRIAESGVREPAFYALQNTAIVTWTRAGFAGGDVVTTGNTNNANNLITQNTPQRVGYRLRNGNFEFLLWPRLDASPRLEPEVTTLLANVQSVRWRFLGNRGSWSQVWPMVRNEIGVDPNDLARELPRAVEVSITFNTGEQIVRLMPVIARGA